MEPHASNYPLKPWGSSFLWPGTTLKSPPRSRCSIHRWRLQTQEKSCRRQRERRSIKVLPVITSFLQSLPGQCAIQTSSCLLRRKRRVRIILLVFAPSSHQPSQGLLRTSNTHINLAVPNAGDRAHYQRRATTGVGRCRRSGQRPRSNKEGYPRLDRCTPPTATVNP